DSQLRLGSKTGNPRLIRSAMSAWWFDASAKELSLGFGGRTRKLHTAKSIRANRDEQLSPGDFAIIARGVHALAYLGDHSWIEADPGIGKVIIIPTNDKNSANSSSFPPRFNLVRSFPNDDEQEFQESDVMMNTSSSPIGIGVSLS